MWRTVGTEAEYRDGLCAPLRILGPDHPSNNEKLRLALAWFSVAGQSQSGAYWARPKRPLQKRSPDWRASIRFPPYRRLS